MFGQNKQVGQSEQPKAKTYRIQIVDDETHLSLWAVHFSKTGYIVVGISVAVVLLVLSYVIFALTPMRATIPGYPNGHTRMAAVQNAIKIDSLERIIYRWELYSDNILRVMEGQKPLPVDSIIKISEIERVQTNDPAYLSRQDSLLRDIVNNQDRTSISETGKKSSLASASFAIPASGMLTEPFRETLHPYVILSVPTQSPVISVLDGTVMMVSWGEASKYSIAVQHADNVVSIYSGAVMCLKKAGDRVRAGETLAMMGDISSNETNVRFELWVDGSAVDPRKYINF